MKIRNTFAIIAVLATLALTNHLHADSRDIPWVETNFPFFTSTLDASDAKGAFPKRNITPRGIILDLGGDWWACFDSDLLRVAAIWKGRGVTEKAMAPASYNHPERKPPPGQFPAPQPDGDMFVANGIYPGVFDSPTPQFSDPRAPAPSREEVGRGPLGFTEGCFAGLELEGKCAVLRYSVGRRIVREVITAEIGSQSPGVVRCFEIGPSETDSSIVVGIVRDGVHVTCTSGVVLKATNIPEVSGSPIWTLTIPASKQLTKCTVLVSESATEAPDNLSVPEHRPFKRWPNEVRSRVEVSQNSTDPFVVDHFELPESNPWSRRIRLSDIQFRSDGTAFAVTIDGDVWRIVGLEKTSGEPRWTRFASGLHEPMSLAIRNDEIYVFDREGIWHLKDSNSDGEADLYEMFSNRFAQTADMRELPATIRCGPQGEFYVAKGGQPITTIGKYNGTILKVAPDGKTFSVWGYGFRQPSMGVDPVSGMVVASDQEGNYVPATPVHEVKDGQFYGFLSSLLPKEVYPAPITEPMVWIPHDVDASGISLLWLHGANLGPLNDQLVHIGFNPPELFSVLPDTRAGNRQQFVMSVTRDFKVPLLNGSVNPKDGCLYLAGFQILGWEATALKTISGLVRVRYVQDRGDRLPVELTASHSGILIRFNTPLAEDAAANVSNYSVTTWNYVRTYKYGSPKLRRDGSVGIDTSVINSVYLSRDRRSVFLAVSDLRPVMQLRVGWSVRTTAGYNAEGSAYTTIRGLSDFEPGSEGFQKLDAAPTKTNSTPSSTPVISADEGRRLSNLYGCVGCHAAGPVAPGLNLVGPPWVGLAGKVRAFPKFGEIVADDAYLRESIVDPSAKIAPGYESLEAGMPNYGGTLSEAQIASLISYIKSLK